MLFWKNLSMFLLGVALQVLSGVFPKLAPAFIGPASVLLSASDVKMVLNGSFIKHLIIFVLAVACQACSAVFPERWGAGASLLAAGGILMAASDIKRVLRGPEVPLHSLVPDPGEVTPVQKTI